MNRLHRILFAVLILPSLATAQEDDWLSLSRLSVSVQSSYHFSPWKSNNNSLAILEDVVKYNHYYTNPRGSFQRVQGDASVDGILSYRVVGGLAVQIVGGFTGTGSELILEDGTTAQGTPGIHYRQEFLLEVIRMGAGLRYEVPLTESIQLVAAAFYQRAKGALDYYYERAAFNTKPNHSLRLNDNTGSYHGTLGLKARLYGSVEIALLADYRHLQFGKFSGSGTYQYINYSAEYEESRTVTAILVEGNGFFGVDILDTQNNGEDYLYRLWDRTPVNPFGNEKRSAVLDLSGIGFSIGLEVGF